MKRSLWTLLFALALAGCGGSSTLDGPVPGHDGGSSKDDGGGIDIFGDGSVNHPDAGTTDGGSNHDDGGTVGDTDAGLGAYADAEVPTGDAGCETDSCAPVDPGCGDHEICGDGLDNDCDGKVDENCGCNPGAVQRCFVGPPGRRNVGVCADGQQTCQGGGELGGWGPCVGGIAPSSELCDDADNDCDGCKDESLCCQAAGSCPSNNDPRVPVGRAFQAYSLDGAQFFFGSARSWQWKVEGGPCDRMLYASSQVVSYSVDGAGSDPRLTSGQRLTFTPTLSGDYTITLTVTQSDGTPFECTFLARVRQPGMRVEICWDTTGQDDVDLWVHQPGSSGDWAQDDQTCFYANCRNKASPDIDWGYPRTSNGACREAAAASGTCQNPRLDIDNIHEPGIPENINVDVPNNGDNFRVGVNFYSRRSGGDDVHPMVNLYCGGELKATFGGASINGTIYGSNPISGFNTGGSNTSGSFWRVADVSMQEPSDSCTIRPLVPSGSSSGACVDNIGDRSYSGACSLQ
jgi:hypothetical protein